MKKLEDLKEEITLAESNLKKLYEQHDSMVESLSTNFMKQIVHDLKVTVYAPYKNR